MITNGMFNITLLHPYYDDGVWQQVRLQPDKFTAEFIERYQLVIRQDTGSLGLYYYGPNDADKFIANTAGLLDGNPLVFDLITENPYWLNLTGLPIDWAGQMDFTCQQDSQHLTMALNSRHTTTDFGIGQVIVSSNDYLSPQGMPMRPQLVLTMPERLTQWRYYVCNQSNLAVDNLQISNSEGIAFESPTEVVLPNGAAAQMFSSGQQQFKLQQSFKTPFQLLNVEQDADELAHAGLTKPVIKALPIPRQDVLEIEHKSGVTTVYSPMYVYI